MARRKRIPYDPPSNRKKRRPAPATRAEQGRMTRRVFLAKGGIVLAFSALAAKLGFMQVHQRQVYVAKAKSNIFAQQQIKAARGMIYDRAGRELASNRRSWQVRVIPAKLPKERARRDEVLDTIAAALDLPEAAVIDPSAVPAGAEETVYGRVATLLGRDPVKFIAYCKEQARTEYLIRAEDELTTDQAAAFRAMLPELPGVSVMNQLRYKVGNAGDPRQKVIVKTNVPREIALKLEANKLYLPGIDLDDDVLVRTYKGGEVMSHILGYVGKINDDELGDERNKTKDGTPLYAQDDVIGKDGIEYSWEEALRGRKGGKVVEIDAIGIEQRTIGNENPAIPGKNLKLTIDLELQAAASLAMQQGIDRSNQDRAAKGTLTDKNRAGSGAVVALDPRTGEVLALVSYPHYDNQLFVDGISQRKWEEYNDEKADKPYFNRATRGAYPPGSTLKPYHAASALQAGKITTDTTFTCTGGIFVPLDFDEARGNVHRCWWPDGHQTLAVVDALEQSCDVFFYNVGAPKQRPEGAAEDQHYYDLNPGTKDPVRSAKHYFQGMGIAEIKKSLQEHFAFGVKTGIELAEEPGVVPDPAYLEEISKGQDHWSLSATINVSIGQGTFLTTPLQLAVNVAAIANGGTILKPLLVRETVDDAQKTVQTFGPQPLRKITIDPPHLATVREGMRRVVHEPQGTANHSTNKETGEAISKWPLTNPPDEPPIIFAGKTGTAEVGEANDQGITEREHAWFTAFAPLDNPEIALAVLIEYGGEGSSYAVPVADQVLRAYFELSGKRPRGKVLREDKVPVTVAAPPAVPVQVPDPGSTLPQRGD